MRKQDKKLMEKLWRKYIKTYGVETDPTWLMRKVHAELVDHVRTYQKREVRVG